MSPQRIDPNVNYRRLSELSEEFYQVWRRLQALYLDAVAGFSLVRGRVETEQTRARDWAKGTELDSEEFQDTRSFTYTQIFAEDFCTSAIHRANQGEAKARNTPGGANFTTLGQLCVISFCDFWNDYLRREYVIAKGKLDRNEKNREVIKSRLSEYARHDLWGDIRLLRNSIVHNQGVANSDIIRCKLIKWFKPGDPISLTPDHMRAIFLALLTYRNALSKEQFPEHYIQIPGLSDFN
jgi:hypothetical protein